MSKQIIRVPNSPDLPLSAGVRAGDFIFVSGQVGFENPKTGEPIKGIEAQTVQCLEGVKEVLETAGSSLKDVVKVNVYLRYTADFGKMNEVYKKYFISDLPARCTVVPALTQPTMLVEVECTAYSPEKR